MANIHPEIKPNGVSDKYLIDLMYMLQQSMYGVCVKLDAEASGDVDYADLCYTAIFHTQVWDYIGNKTQNATTVDHVINPGGGLSNAALIEWIYNWVNAFETLTEKLDLDAGITDDADYEELCYWTCVLPYMFESGRYDQTTILGNDCITGGFSATPDKFAPWIATKIGPTGKPSDNVLCDLFYDFINAWETMCEKIDADAVAAAPPAATNYESLWYTATVLMKVENCQGNVLGNAQTRLG